MSTVTELTPAEQALQLALSTGRGSFIKGIDVQRMTVADVEALRDTLAAQIDANAANYARYSRLRREGQALMEHIVRGPMRQAARLAAIADPQYPVDADVSDDSLRSRTDEIILEWTVQGYGRGEETP